MHRRLGNSFPTPQSSVPVSRAGPRLTPATGLSGDRWEDSRTSEETRGSLPFPPPAFAASPRCSPVHCGQSRCPAQIPTIGVTHLPLHPGDQGRQVVRLGPAVPGRSVTAGPSLELRQRGRSSRTPLGAVSAGIANTPSHSTIRDGPARVRGRTRYKRAHSQTVPPCSLRRPVDTKPWSTNRPPRKSIWSSASSQSHGGCERGTPPGPKRRWSETGHPPAWESSRPASRGSPHPAALARRHNGRQQSTCPRGS